MNMNSSNMNLATGMAIGAAMANDDYEDEIRKLKKKGRDAHMILLKNLFAKKKIGGFMGFGTKDQFVPTIRVRERAIRICEIETIITTTDDFNKTVTCLVMEPEEWDGDLYTDESVESLTKRINDILNGRESI